MRMLMTVAAATALGVATPLAAQPAASDAGADAAAQALGQCLVLKSTGADRLTVARWLLSAIASAPKVADMVSIGPDQHDAADKSMAQVFTRLLTTDCAAETRVLFKDRTEAGFRVAGEALGRVAMEELFNDPKAKAALGSYTRYLDRTAFTAVLPDSAKK
jgi:hypothetical protein